VQFTFPVPSRSRALMIRPWVFEFFPELNDAAKADNPKLVTSYFSTYLDLWAGDEARGFEGIFFSEHHFGGAYGASPNLLIAATAMRTRTLRLGVMGVVTPYYQPWRLFEEIGMLDHMTGGRLEIGTAVGIPQEMAQVGISMQEARERNDEAIAILDAALANDVISFHGKYFNFDNLRPLPRPLQRPSPPKWTTVVSDDSARKAARRHSKICTGFNPKERVKAIFDCYRDEADKAGIKVSSDHLALRRRVVVADSDSEAKEKSAAVAERLRAQLSKDPRATIKAPDPNKPVPDDAKPQGGGGFAIGEDEFIAGTPAHVAEEIIEQCRFIGAAHFLAVLHWGAPVNEVVRGHDLFARDVIPLLRKAAV
jgi:alkanesulfonate monooxygenase SsuD/methylene tetrahydromethanopterin reductase-like flavin-dependent oxidoreductase (luciferase family)